MRLINSKKHIILVALMIVIALGVASAGTTYAWLCCKTDVITNTFTIASAEEVEPVANGLELYSDNEEITEDDAGETESEDDAEETESEDDAEEAESENDAEEVESENVEESEDGIAGEEDSDGEEDSITDADGEEVSEEDSEVEVDGNEEEYTEIDEIIE